MLELTFFSRTSITRRTVELSTYAKSGPKTPHTRGTHLGTPRLERRTSYLNFNSGLDLMHLKTKDPIQCSIRKLTDKTSASVGPIYILGLSTSAVYPDPHQKTRIRMHGLSASVHISIHVLSASVAYLHPNGTRIRGISAHPNGAPAPAIKRTAPLTADFSTRKHPDSLRSTVCCVAPSAA